MYYNLNILFDYNYIKGEIRMFNLENTLKKINNELNLYYENGKTINVHIQINNNDAWIRYSFIPENINIDIDYIYIEYNGIQTIINNKIEEIIFDPDNDGQNSYLLKMGYLEIYFDFI